MFARNICWRCCIFINVYFWNFCKDHIIALPLAGFIFKYFLCVCLCGVCACVWLCIVKGIAFLWFILVYVFLLYLSVNFVFCSNYISALGIILFENKYTVNHFSPICVPFVTFSCHSDRANWTVDTWLCSLSLWKVFTLKVRQ